MQRDITERNRKRRLGPATIEFALLMLMMVGAADFARVFYHAVEVTNASGTGSFGGSGCKDWGPLSYRQIPFVRCNQ